MGIGSFAAVALIGAALALFRHMHGVSRFRHNVDMTNRRKG